MVRITNQELSRRRFMKTALAGGMTAIASTGSWESAAAMLAVPVGRSVNGVGIDDPELVQLSINENPLGASPHAIEAVAHKMFSLNRYPPREPVLHEAIAKYHVNDGISIDMVATGVGSTEILKAIGMLAMIDGGNVIEPVPGYGAVSGVASTLGREPIRIPLTEDLQTDLNTVKDAVNSETRIVIFTNPNNPTGQLIPHTDLVAFLDSVPESVIVCVDEAYIHFVGDTSYRNMVGLTKTRKNLFVARTMSKAFGLGGMRVGYGIGHPELISRVRPHLLGWLGRSVLGDVASIAALGDRQHLQDVRTHVSREKEYLYQALTELGLKPVKTETIFVIADMGRNTEPFIQELAARKVLIRQAFGMDNYIRISTGTHTENEILIEVMKEVMSKGV